MTSEETLKNLGLKKKEHALFLQIADRTSQGFRITKTKDQNFLMDLVGRILANDNTQLLELFLKAKIEPIDAGSEDTYVRWFLAAKQPKCLKFYLNFNENVNLNTQLKTLGGATMTVLQVAVESSTPAMIDILLDHAHEHQISYDNTNVVSHAVSSFNSHTLEHVLALNFSPYTNDNKDNPYISSYDKQNNTIYSMIFYASAKTINGKGSHAILIDSMTDVSKMIDEKKFFLAFLKAGHSTTMHADHNPHKDTEIIKLLDQKIKFLTEKKLLEKQIASVSSHTVNSELNKNRHYKI